MWDETILTLCLSQGAAEERAARLSPISVRKETRHCIGNSSELFGFGLQRLIQTDFPHINFGSELL